MAYSTTKQGDSTDYGVVELCCDNKTDIANLPTNYSAGSSCICIEDSSVYMLTTTGVWKEI